MLIMVSRKIGIMLTKYLEYNVIQYKRMTMIWFEKVTIVKCVGKRHHLTLHLLLQNAQLSDSFIQ